MANDIGRRFMEETKHRYAEPSDQDRGVRQPPLQEPSGGKTEAIPLSAPESGEFPQTDFWHLTERRRSLRKFADTPLALSELGALLWATQGVKKVVSSSVTFRTVPSAGARHAFETLVLANRVEGLERGLYRYLALENALEPRSLGPEISHAVTRACFDQGFVGSSAVTLIWVAVAYRMTWRYGQRGYRYLHLDAGHVCQNAYLAAEALGCGACGVAAFSDDDLNRSLGLDGLEQFAIYLAAIGKRE
jgi:SagB-type dehydrogenase family enzyme